jgi:hypothetical protein
MAFLLGETLELAAEVLQLPTTGPYDPLPLRRIDQEIYDVLWNVCGLTRRRSTVRSCTRRPIAPDRPAPRHARRCPYLASLR